MMVFQLIVVTILSYLLGSINLSIVISKRMGKGDIREYGSGNAGTTNTLRVLGKGPALLVFIFDILKGVIAVLLARWIAHYSDLESYNLVYVCGIMLASIAVIVGHNFPIYFGFKGGKGVATSMGVVLAIEWEIGLACLITGISMVALFNMVSIGSIIAAILYPVLIFVMGGNFDTLFKPYRLLYIAFSLLLSLSIIFRHKANIMRIREGTENKLFKSKKEFEDTMTENLNDIKSSVASGANKVKDAVVSGAEQVKKNTEEAIAKAKEQKQAKEATKAESANADEVEEQENTEDDNSSNEQ